MKNVGQTRTRKHTIATHLVLKDSTTSTRRYCRAGRETPARRKNKRANGGTKKTSAIGGRKNKMPSEEKQLLRTVTIDCSPKTAEVKFYCCANGEQKTALTSVKYNPWNMVVQCHNCGHVWRPLTDEEYKEGVTIDATSKDEK